MITVCPKCALTLAVTAADLRVGQGQVRCGRCAAVFNALAALQDDLAESIEQPRSPDVAADVAPDSGQEQVVSISFVNIEEPQTTPDASGIPCASSAATAQLPEPSNDAEAYAPPSANDDMIDPLTANEPMEPDGYPSLDLDLTPARPRATRNYWLAGACVLFLLLGMQAVHHNRSALATSDNWRGPLQSLYRLFGIELQPAWQPAAFAVQRRGEMMADDQGAMTLRASLRNSAAYSQPLPLLRVVLLDRFGARIAARDLEPQEYLPARVAAEMRYLAAGQRVDAEVALADPGPAAAGFELDACLQVAPQRLQCANHTAVRR